MTTARQQRTTGRLPELPAELFDPNQKGVQFARFYCSNCHAWQPVWVPDNRDRTSKERLYAWEWEHHNATGHDAFSIVLVELNAATIVKPPPSRKKSRRRR